MITFDVIGQPRSKGNMTAFCQRNCRGQGRPIVTEAKGKRGSDLAKWLRAVEIETLDACGDRLIEGPVRCELVFRFERPKTVQARAYPDNRSTPDIDKLTRAVLDAIQARAGGSVAAIQDDAQIAHLLVRKVWCAASEQPGCRVTLEAMEPPQEVMPL